MPATPPDASGQDSAQAHQPKAARVAPQPTKPERTARAATKTATTSARKSPRARLGESGERLVAHHLEARGLRIVARNWHCAGGEVDIIARDGAEWVFVEVKTRRGDAMGAPEEAVTRTKQRRMLLAAQTYLMERDEAEAPYRIDVVAVHVAPNGALADIRHYANAIMDES